LGRSYLGSCRPKAPGSASCRNLTPKLRIQRNAALPTSSVGSRNIIPFGGAGGGKWQIPNAGGSQPVWRRDGRKIFYLSLDSTLTSVPVRLKGGTDEVGAVHPLFRVNNIVGNIGVVATFDALADGKRFIVLTKPKGRETRITLVTN
jgi:hypothetical protein